MPCCRAVQAGRWEAVLALTQRAERELIGGEEGELPVDLQVATRTPVSLPCASGGEVVGGFALRGGVGWG